MKVAWAEHNTGPGKMSLTHLSIRLDPCGKDSSTLIRRAQEKELQNYRTALSSVTATKQGGCRWIGAHRRVLRHIERVIRVIGHRLIPIWSLITSMSE